MRMIMVMVRSKGMGMCNDRAKEGVRAEANTETQKQRKMEVCTRNGKKKE